MKDTIEQTKDNVKETAHDAKKEMEKGTESDTYKSIARTAEDTKDAIKHKAQDAKEAMTGDSSTGTSGGKSLGDKFEEAKEYVKDKKDELVEGTKEKKHEAKYEHKKDGDLGDKAEAAVEKGKEKFHEAKKEGYDTKADNEGMMENIKSSASNAYEAVTDTLASGYEKAKETINEAVYGDDSKKK